MTEEASMRRVMIVLLVAASVALGACAAKRPVAAPPAAPAANEAVQGSGASSASAAAGADEEAAGPQAGLLATKLVYFDFDSSEIKGTGTDVVAAHAKYLAAHSETRVRLEGHTDERGSREYNIGLGERRAQAGGPRPFVPGGPGGPVPPGGFRGGRPPGARHRGGAPAQKPPRL